jgi:hypothetical protein
MSRDSSTITCAVQCSAVVREQPQRVHVLEGQHRDDSAVHTMIDAHTGANPTVGQGHSNLYSHITEARLGSLACCVSTCRPPLKIHAHI